VDASPALVLRFPPGTTAPFRDRLVALLADYDLVAIQEDDLNFPQVWTTHFNTRLSRDEAAEAIAADSEFALVEVDRIEIEDEDWARRTQADLPAIRIGRVTIAPPWDIPPPTLQVPDPNITVLIEPSRGFGTGHHQSTRLCIVLLQARNLSGLTVTDVGTGSGVLAITAARLGAAFVTAMDNDPDAVENARENIRANGVDSVVEAHVDDLATTKVAAADLVTANLTGTLLAQHAPDLARLVRAGGSMIVSGFNVDEKERVTEALTPLFGMSEMAEEDDWYAFVVTRPASKNP
jgi:ribosomal protein L11 methyltransferase